MAPRGFTNPAPKTDSARSALSSFTCTLCNKSYSRHPEYEAHIGSYDHQHRKRLQDLKQLSRDPNAAERARKAERKADAEAGLLRVDNNNNNGASSTTAATSNSTGGGGGGGGFKKGGFKSSFTAVKGPGASTSTTATPVKRNVLGDDDDDDEGVSTPSGQKQSGKDDSKRPLADNNDDDAESDIDDEYGQDGTEDAYYNPLKPTGCFDGCSSVKAVPVT